MGRLLAAHNIVNYFVNRGPIGPDEGPHTLMAEPLHAVKPFIVEHSQAALFIVV